MNQKILESEYENIVNLYKSGLLQREIAEIYGVKRMAINAILKKCGVSELGTAYKSRKIIFLESEEKDICDIYLSGMSSVEIGRMFNCNHKTITRILDKYAIDRIGNGLRHYNLNENYFDNIDTSNKAYILGFFYADGSNNLNKQTISMSLQEEDKEILERIRLEIGSEKELEFLDYSNKHDGGYNYKNQYRLLMFSKHMSNILSSYGMVQNKSLVLQFPTCVPDNLISHFMRGYMDGDGHIGKTEKDCSVSFISTNDFCSNASKVIMKQIGAETRTVEAACKNGITVECLLKRKNDKKTFLDWIYKDADLKLERKYRAYIEKYC